MQDLISQYSTQLIPRGVYRVGDKVFENKISAIAHGDATNTHPTWDFHDAYFSSFNWQQEPEHDINYYYSTRCHQLRAKYDYLVLHYSGGSDSHNILTHFFANAIPVDEILVAAPVSYYERHTSASLSTDAGDLHNEWFNVIKPDLEWVGKNMPETKITIYDYTKDMLQFDVDQDWALHVGEHLNPNVINRINRYQAINQDLYDAKNVAHIYGIDKPQVFVDNNHWYFAFLDSILSIQSSYKPMFDRHTHVNVENFYWSPDLPQLLIKQAHMVKNFFIKNPHLQHLATFKNRSRADREHYQNIIREVVYPHWRNTIFQNKKATNVFFKEFDRWFWQLADHQAQNRWLEGYRFLISAVSDNWINRDASGNPSGIMGMWSRWHQLD